MPRNELNAVTSRSLAVCITAVSCLGVFLPLCMRGGSAAEKAAVGSQPPAHQSADPTEAVPPSASSYTTQSLRGRVVWLSDALERRLGVKTETDAKENVIALEEQGGEGQLHPIVEDLRGRSFRKDPRLLKMDLELFVRRYKGTPMIQIIHMYQHTPEGKFMLDYWCDICSITMYEFGPCACCQDQNRLRKRPAESVRPGQ